MDNHICFKCKNVRKRKVGTFVETACDYFPAVKQQLIAGDVVECDYYEEEGKKDDHS